MYTNNGGSDTTSQQDTGYRSESYKQTSYPQTNGNRISESVEEYSSETVHEYISTASDVSKQEAIHSETKWTSVDPKWNTDSSKWPSSSSLLNFTSWLTKSDSLSRTGDNPLPQTSIWGNGDITSEFHNTTTTTTATTANKTTPFPGYINIQNLSMDFELPFSFDNFTGCDFSNETTCAPFNGTNTTDITPSIPPKVWVMFLAIFPFFTVFGNLLVVMAVYREKSLKTVTNYFIVSLAIADILVGILVMPLAVYVEINNGAWGFGDTLCDIWVCLDVMGCTASILNLTSISVDRFIAVTQPLKYAKHKNSKRVQFMLAFCWAVSIAISSPIALGMNYTERRHETPELCVFYNADFLIYSSMGSFYIPCVIMVLLYWRIFKAIRERAKKAKLHKKPKTFDNKAAAYKSHVVEVKSQAQTTTSDASATDHDHSQRELLPRASQNHGVKATITEETSFNNATTATDSDSPSQDVSKSPHSDDTDNVTQHGNGKQNVLSPVSEDNTGPVDYREKDSGYSAPTTVEVEHGGASRIVSPTSPPNLLSPPSRKGLGKFKNNANLPKTKKGVLLNSRKSVTKFNFHLRHHSKKKKDRSANRRERKATKTLAIVLGVFLFCWVPFFTINIMNAICIRYDLFARPECNIDPMLFSFFVWLGYMNSFLNPVIYTIFNIEFRKAFKKIIAQPCPK